MVPTMIPLPVPDDSELIVDFDSDKPLLSTVIEVII
jgi:hypothetical protein